MACLRRHGNVVSRMKSPLFNPDGMSINLCQNTEQPVFYILTLSHLAIPMVPLVFSGLGHTIKCVTVKIKRNLTAGNGKVPGVLVPQMIFIKLIVVSPN